MKGAETETTIVYLVKEHPLTATLKYDQGFGPELKHIDHYTLSQSSNSDKIIKADDKVLESNSQNSTSWYDKGVELDDLNKSDEAIKAYNKAIEDKPAVFKSLKRIQNFILYL